MVQAADTTEGTQAASISQYGITWTFDGEYRVGQFITGDWWVVGPVTIREVSPAAGPDNSGSAKGKTVKSRYGATGMVDDARMRNGSMIVAESGGKQGYDSRLVNFDPALSVSYPLALEVGQSLLSTVSTTEGGKPVLLADIMWKSEATGAAALQSGAVLTCLAAVPPADAFRPPYAGTKKPLFRESQLHWDLLPKLAAPQDVPDWAMVERWFERPWFDHISSWVFQLTGPQENQANYGREFCRSTAIASLMLMLDVPKETKRTLLIRFVQRGIDTYGLVESGRKWSGDGGHWNGRKWPLLFAGLLLDDQSILTAVATGLFSEDQQTYLGKSFSGQTALYQIVTHTGPKPPYEEKDPATWDAADKRSEGYRKVCSGGWPGLALAVQLMQAKAIWNHNAFFDYNDRWMTDPESKGLPVGSGRADAFVQVMWDTYRSSVPKQAGGTANRKWLWDEKRFVEQEP